jgi:hypothetical protein
MSPEPHDQQPAEQPKPRRRWWLIAVPAVLVAGGAVWLVVALLTPGTFTVEGQLKFRTNCDNEGVQVEILDRESNPLAVGKLVEDKRNPCLVSFTVPNVPAGEDLYGVRVGDGRLGGVMWKTEAELRSGEGLTTG